MEEHPTDSSSPAGQVVQRILPVLWKIEEAGRDAKVHLGNCLALSDRVGLLRPTLQDIHRLASETEGSALPNDPNLEVLLLRLERTLKRGLIILRRCGGRPYHISVSSFHRDLHLSLKQISLTIVDCVADLFQDYSSLLPTASGGSLDVQWALQSVTFTPPPIDQALINNLGNLLSELLREFEGQELSWKAILSQLQDGGGANSEALLQKSADWSGAGSMSGKENAGRRWSPSKGDQNSPGKNGFSPALRNSAPGQVEGGLISPTQAQGVFKSGGKFAPHASHLEREVNTRLRLNGSAVYAVRVLRSAVRRATWLDSVFASKLTEELERVRQKVLEDHSSARSWLETGLVYPNEEQRAIVLRLQTANDELRATKLGRRAREVVREIVRMLRRRILELQSAAHHTCDTSDAGLAGFKEWQGSEGPNGWSLLLVEEFSSMQESAREVSKVMETLQGVLEEASGAIGELFSDTAEWSRLRKDLTTHNSACLEKLVGVFQRMLQELEASCPSGPARGSSAASMEAELRLQLKEAIERIAQGCAQQSQLIVTVLPLLEGAVARIKAENRAREEGQGAHLLRLTMRRVTSRSKAGFTSPPHSGGTPTVVSDTHTLPTAVDSCDPESQEQAAVMTRFQEMTEFMTALWFGSPGDQEAAAEKLLESCDSGAIAISSEATKYIPSEKWAKSLTVALRSDKGIVQSAAATAIVCLAATDELRMIFGTDNTIKALLEVVRRSQGRGDAESQVLSRAVFALGQLARVEAVRVIATDQDVPRMVVPLLAEEDLELKESACLCLKNLAFKDPPQDTPSLRAVRVAIAKERAILPLLACLSSGTLETRVYALGCLAGLAQCPRDLIPRLKARVVLPKIVPLLGAQSSETRGYAAAAVARFDQSEDEVEMVVDLKGVPVLLEIVRKGPDRCRTHALKMLSAIAGMQSKDYRSMLALDGGLPLLIAQLTKNSTVEVKLLAVEVLSRLSENAVVRRATVAAGAVRPLATLLEKEFANERVRTSIALLLSDLATEPAVSSAESGDAGATILGTGGLALMVAIVHFSQLEDATLKPLLRALVTMCQSSHEATEEVANSGGQVACEHVIEALRGSGSGRDAETVMVLVSALQKMLNSSHGSE